MSGPDRPTPDLLGALQDSLVAARRPRVGADLPIAPADVLAAHAVSKLRKHAEEHEDDEIEALLTEFDRRGAVEKAAADYVMAGLCGNPSTSVELTALIAAVRTNGEFRG